MSTLYPTVTLGTVSFYEPTDSWMLEIWTDGTQEALAMWPLKRDATDLDADSYAEVKLVLQQAGVFDEERDSWERTENRWSAPLLPRPWKE